MSAFSRRSKLALLLPSLVVGCAGAHDELNTPAHELAQAESSERPAPPLAEPSSATSLDFPVRLRETGSATIHATIFENDAAPEGQTVLAVHGLAETGAGFEPLAQAAFADDALGKKLRRIVAIDLVGHGKSSMPQDLPAPAQFGTLTIEDNVSVVVQAIEALRARELAPQVIVGHSMGGLEVQATQEHLLAKGSSLAALGITRAVLLAPVPPHARPWQQPGAGSDVSAFVVQDATLGAYVALPPEVWIAQAFTTRQGTPASNAPTPEVVAAKGYVGFEPLATLLQLIEAPVPLPSGDTIVVPRPSVRADAFAPAQGTELTLVSFAEDTLVPSPELGELYEYLTGDATRARYVEVTSADAVHSMFISNPVGLLDATRTLF